MRASLLCALCALGAAVPAPIKGNVLAMTPPPADRAHDLVADGPTHGGATGANTTDPVAPPETLTAKSEAGAAASPETHDATQAGATASASLIDASASPNAGLAGSSGGIACSKVNADGSCWNCWGGCNGSGPCAACGQGGGCCQRGFANDHPDCPADQKQYGHHTCVALCKKQYDHKDCVALSKKSTKGATKKSGYENPCPSSHPILEKYDTGSAYWCYERAGNGGAVCRMSNSGIAPPPDGTWGTNQNDCTLTGATKGATKASASKATAAADAAKAKAAADAAAKAKAAAAPLCSDPHPGWKDSYDESCTAYEDKKFCTRDGGEGSGWKKGWGPFAKYAMKGIDATKACCACGAAKAAAAKGVFGSSALLKAAVKEWFAGKASAEAKHGAIKDWDTSQVDDLSELFEGKEINQPLAWDTSEVKNMEYTFAGTNFNYPLDWDTSSLTTMRGTFQYSNFNHPLVWDTSQVKTMLGTFQYSNFNYPLDWDTSSLTTMRGTFQYSNFNKPLVWDTRQVKNMAYTFAGTNFFNYPLDWDTSSVTTMGGTFAHAARFNSELAWDTSSVTTMVGTFWETGSEVMKVKHGRHVEFGYNKPLYWDTSKVKMMYGNGYPSVLKYGYP